MRLYIHLQMADQPLQCDLLSDLVEQATAAQNHARQDVQGHLLNGGVHHLGIHKTGDLCTYTDTYTITHMFNIRNVIT